VYAVFFGNVKENRDDQPPASRQAMVLRAGYLYSFLIPILSMHSPGTPAISVILVLLLAICGCTEEIGQENTMTGSTPTLVRLETTMGNITIQLADDMPVTAGNFEKLVREGYYDGIIFHRVIDGFMIQGGDPTGTGRGGPGYRIPDEFTSRNRNDRGTISMANAGPNTGGSQFFINLVDNNHLDTKHPVFGRIIEGMDVIDRIGSVETGTGDRPVKEVRITRAVVV
jgi:peptidylprolyl isomerase